MQRDEVAGWLRLAATPHIGPMAARRLLAAFGLPERIFSAPTAALREVVGPMQAEALGTEPPEMAAQADAVLAWLDEDRASRTLLTLADPLYPTGLLQTEDPPLMLYLRGRLDLLAQHGWPQALAMVGSRNPTPQGKLNARQFANAFADAGWTVVSGLALGVDGAAHEGALESAGAGTLATIAVVGTGLDRVYPRHHLALARRIEQQGLIASEYPLGTPPLAQNFPRRNRIIAALSQGTLVVEAALQSGSLITARLAVEQGKDVFAIPGSIHAAQARGCHALIKQGAKLVETAQDVLEELAPQVAGRADGMATADGAVADSQPGGEFDDPLLEAMGHDPVSLDALIARTGIPASQLQAQLLTLELDGVVGRLPGGLFQRIGSA